MTASTTSTTRPAAETTPRATTAARRKSKKKMDGWSLAGWFYLVLLLIFSVVPLLWMLLTSVKAQFAALQYPPQWIPSDPTLMHYRDLLDPAGDVGKDFLRYLLNSL